jgi:hypothetical protein
MEGIKLPFIIEYVQVRQFWLPNPGGLVAVLRSPDRSLNTCCLEITRRTKVALFINA